jgi:hypothetical protein
MSETQAKYLDTFPAWLRDLGHDAEDLAELLDEKGLDRDARESIVGGLNYLFKSLDLIPDGIDDIGYLDDAFVLRVAAELAEQEGSDGVGAEKKRVLGRLSKDCELLREFLDKDYDRLASYVKGLRRGSARGRSVADILSNDQTQRDFLSDVRGFARSYQAPSFTREEKNLIKLKAFFDAKLPR